MIKYDYQMIHEGVFMFSSFKKFIMRGNVMDLAVAVIIGAAFGKIVTSLVNDILMPIIGLIIGKVDFSSLKWVLIEAQGEQDAVAILYGQFLQNILDFVIIALSIFIIIKVLERFKKKEDAKPAAPAQDIVLLTEIRDLLKDKND